jgi:serine/threonine protein kinase
VKIASLRNDPEKKFAVKSIPRHLFDMAGLMKLRENKKNVLDKNVEKPEDHDEELMQDML